MVKRPAQRAWLTGLEPLPMRFQRTDTLLLFQQLLFVVDLRLCMGLSLLACVVRGLLIDDSVAGSLQLGRQIVPFDDKFALVLSECGELAPLSETGLGVLPRFTQSRQRLTAEARILFLSRGL
jgi:hypothetical protein